MWIKREWSTPLFFCYNDNMVKIKFLSKKSVFLLLAVIGFGVGFGVNMVYAGGTDNTCHGLVDISVDFSQQNQTIRIYGAPAIETWQNHCNHYPTGPSYSAITDSVKYKIDNEANWHDIPNTALGWRRTPNQVCTNECAPGYPDCDRTYEINYTIDASSFSVGAHTIKVREHEWGTFDLDLIYAADCDKEKTFAVSCPTGQQKPYYQCGSSYTCEAVTNACGANQNGCTSAGGSCVPTGDIKANGSNGPITIAPNETYTISWTSSN